MMDTFLSRLINLLCLGALCGCPEWLNLDVDNVTCVDKDECKLPWTCSQKCVNVEKHYYCLCSEGYSPQANKTCRADIGVYM